VLPLERLTCNSIHVIPRPQSIVAWCPQKAVPLHAICLGAARDSSGVSCCICYAGCSSPCDASVSPEPVAHLSQHRLAQLLLNKAQQLAVGAGANLHFNTRVDSVSLVTFPHQQQQQVLGHHHQHSPPHQPRHQQQQENSMAVSAGQGLQHTAGGGSSAAAASSGSAAGLDQEAQAYPLCVAVARLGRQQQQQRKEMIRCKYLVAADGSHSTIR